MLESVGSHGGWRSTQGTSPVTRHKATLSGSTAEETETLRKVTYLRLPSKKVCFLSTTLAKSSEI